ncbi:MAG: transaldolase family protein, partial [Longimicrobiales bacterium]
MKFFLDSSDLKEIRRGMEAGLVDGITTNPTLLAKAAGAEGKPREILADICRTVPGPISAEVVATNTEAMVREGRDLAKIADNIVVKVPLTEEGLHACRRFRAEGILVNVTLCF